MKRVIIRLKTKTHLFKSMELCYRNLIDNDTGGFSKMKIGPSGSQHLREHGRHSGIQTLSWTNQVRRSLERL